MIDRNQVELVFGALYRDMASGHCMSGGEETYVSWDASLSLQLCLAILSPEFPFLARMTEAERWTWAGESLCRELCLRLVGEDCAVCATPIGEHDAAQHYSCTAVQASGDY